MTLEVALPLPFRRTYTYSVPEPLLPRVSPGSRVVVPFRGSPAVGFVVEVHPADSGRPVAGPPPREPFLLREILEAPDEQALLTPEILDLTRWAADYYLCSWGEMIRVAVPGASSLTTPRRVRVTVDGRREVEGLLPGTGGGGERLLRALLRGGERGLARESALKLAGRGGGVALAHLVSSGLAEIVEEAPRAAKPAEVRRREREVRGRSTIAGEGDGVAIGGTAGRGATSSEAHGAPADPAMPLSGDQTAALEIVLGALGDPAPLPVLLHGVTGSGKTEVYLGAIAACLERGRDALYLVPEIGLTPLLAHTIRARFGPTVAVLHSGLAAGERSAEWRRILDGQARVVLGPRSAVFAPLRRLGLVVIDEEHDHSYKQEDPPRYNGRDLALVRARGAGALAVLGSATPSLETWRHARTGKYRLATLPSRVAGRPMPRIEVVDMRVEFRETGETRPLSRRLAASLQERITRGEQAIVLINRRGYAPFFLCRSCGKTVGCSRCSVSLVLHEKGESLRCHYCGARRRRPVLCPSCLSEHLQAIGQGTERVESHLRRLLPDSRIARMDSDTVRGRKALEEILTAFGRRQYDVIVGTQMVAKGHDFPGVTLVGVLLTDATLGLPDFRAAERTYQLLTQVAGRAGRGEVPGEVIVQTARPDHYAVAAALSGDEEAFIQHEMRARRALRHPPFTVLAQVLTRSSRPEKATLAARRAAESLKRHGGGRVEVLGPAPAPIARLKGRYRVQVLARAVSRRRLGAALKGMMAEAEADGTWRELSVDVDPVRLL